MTKKGGLVNRVWIPNGSQMIIIVAVVVVSASGDPHRCHGESTTFTVPDCQPECDWQVCHCPAASHLESWVMLCSTHWCYLGMTRAPKYIEGRGGAILLVGFLYSWVL